MKLVTRFVTYLTRLLVAFLVVFGGAICGLFILMDAAQRMIKCYSSDVGFLVLAGRAAQYYLVGMPGLLAEFAPIAWTVAVAAALLFVKRRNEIVALNAAGRSSYRILAPVYVLSVAISAFVWVCNEKIVPGLSPVIRTCEQKVTWRSHGDRIVVETIPGRQFCWIDSFDPARDLLNSIVTVSYTEDGRVAGVQWAKRGSWRDGKLRLEGVRTLSLGGDKSRAAPPDAVGPVGLTREMISRAETPTEMNSAKGIKALMKQMPGNLFFAMTYYDHFVSPLVPVIFVLMAIPLVLGNELVEWGTGRNIFACIILCTSFYAVKSVCHNLGATGNLSPAVAACLPAALFLAVGAYLFSALRT